MCERSCTSSGDDQCGREQRQQAGGAELDALIAEGLEAVIQRFTMEGGLA